MDFNILAVVNALNADDPEGFYSFFKSIGCHYIQFAPIVERYHADGRLATVGEPDEESRLSSFSVSPEQWGDFLYGLFDA